MSNSTKIEATDIAFNPDDPSLRVLSDSRTMTVVSILDAERRELLIADIQPGASLLRDVDLLQGIAASRGAAYGSAVLPRMLPGGDLRLIVKTWTGNL